MKEVGEVPLEKQHTLIKNCIKYFMFSCICAISNETHGIWNKYSSCVFIKTILSLMRIFGFVFFPPLQL